MSLWWNRINNIFANSYHHYKNNHRNTDNVKYDKRNKSFKYECAIIININHFYRYFQYPKYSYCHFSFILFITECRTKNNGPEPNKPCLFPFKYQDKVYNECTTDGYGSTYWCATAFPVTNSAGWGLCSSSCLATPGNELIY